MKFFLVIMCAIAAVTAQDNWSVKHFSELQGYRNNCAASLNVPAETFANYELRIFSDTDDLAKSYVRCMFEKLGVFGENGFYANRVVAQFGAGPSDAPRLERCTTRINTDTTNDIWAFRAFRCFSQMHEREFYAQLDVKD